MFSLFSDTDALILKLRRERAESDSLLKQERELVSLTEVKCEQLQSELSSSRIAWEVDLLFLFYFHAFPISFHLLI